MISFSFSVFDIVSGQKTECKLRGITTGRVYRIAIYAQNSEGMSEALTSTWRVKAMSGLSKYQRFWKHLRCLVVVFKF